MSAECTDAAAPQMRTRQNTALRNVHMILLPGYLPPSVMVVSTAAPVATSCARQYEPGPPANRGPGRCCVLMFRFALQTAVEI